MATIFERFCEDRDAMINPCDLTPKVDGFPEVCVTTFSEGIINDFIGHNPAKIIAYLYTANGQLPVYEIEYAGKKIGLFLSRVGAPTCMAGLEDAIYRETRQAVEERKKQGCIAVEMECSASMAAARFRKITILQFFYGADSLDSDKWEPRDLTDYGMSCKDKYMAIALECGIEL